MHLVVLLYCDQGLVFVSLGETFNQERQNENVRRYEIDAKIRPDRRLLPWEHFLKTTAVYKQEYNVIQ